MKKLLLTTCAMILGTILAYSQGTINTLNQSAIISTNNGANIGPIAGGNGSYLFEVLDMQQSTWTGLSGLQQAEAYDLIDNPSAVALWTDSGVPAQHQSVHVGGISGAPVTALNWPSPGSSSGYGGAGQTPDYYTIVGWSANEGAGWATVAAELNGSTAWTVSGPGSWFGQTAVAFNYAGGGTAAVPPPSVELWGISTTGLAGSGGVMSMTLSPIPEPSTMVLAGLGGLSLLLFRRRH